MSDWVATGKATYRMEMLASICATLANSTDRETCAKVMRNRYRQMGGYDWVEIEEAIDIARRLCWVTEPTQGEQ